MLSRLHTAHSTDNGIARITVSAMLALVLLAGLFPSGALSASHHCKMACCAGKPPHEAGACKAVIPSATENETAQEADADKHSMHHGGMQMTGVTVKTAASPDHCHTARYPSAPPPAPHSAPLQQTGVVAQAFTAPCSAECAALAALTLMQVRRPRDAAALSIAGWPRPPTFVSRSDSLFNLSFSSAERRRQSRPRAPPPALVNFYA